MVTSGEPMLRIFRKITSPVFTILSYYVSYPVLVGIFYESIKASSGLRCYDIIGFIALLYLSRRLDLLNPIASRKTRKCQDFFGVSIFLLELRLYHVN